MTLSKTLASAAVGIVLAGTPALAQSSQSTGTTSGPAAGTNVEPGAATQKKAGNNPDVSAGAPGAAAKKGSESGSKPKKGTSPD